MSGPSFDRVIEAWRSAGLDIDVKGDRAMAQAPNHTGKSGNSGYEISLRHVGDKTVIQVFNGDDAADVLSAVDLGFADLYDDPKRERRYCYPDGAVVHKTWGANGRKKIRQSGDTKSDKSLLHTEFEKGRPVYLCEGESDVETARALGVQATTNRGGADNAVNADLSPLYGHRVIVVADDDEAGHKRAFALDAALKGKARVTVVYPLAGKDLTDHIAAGHELEDLLDVTFPALAEPEPQGRRVMLSPFADEVDDVPVWAWDYDGKGRIPVGAVTLFAGRPGAGKSTAGRWIAACASTGTLSGCWMGKPVNVAYLSTAEESAKYVVKPGLRAAGADLTRVLRPKVQFEGEDVRFLSDRDMGDLTDLLVDQEVKLVVVDPLMATIGSKTDINRNNEVRGLIEPWAKLAEKIDGVVIGIAHLNKSGNGDVVAGINGSSAFGEVARAVFGFTKDHESEDDERIMSQEKNSIGEEDLAITYRIESQKVTTDSGNQADVGRFVVVGNSDRSVGEVLRAQASGASAEGSRTHPVDEWLLDLLSKAPVWTKEIFDAASGNGYTNDRVRGAKDRLNKKDEMVSAKKVGTTGWCWYRPDLLGKIVDDRPYPPEPPMFQSSPSSKVREIPENSSSSEHWEDGKMGVPEGSTHHHPNPANLHAVDTKVCPTHLIALGAATGKCTECIVERQQGVAS